MAISYESKVITTCLGKQADWFLACEMDLVLPAAQPTIVRQLSDAQKSRAFAQFITDYIDAHHRPSPPDRCAFCGSPETPSAVVVPYGGKTAGHVWLHHVCWGGVDGRTKATGIG